MTLLIAVLAAFGLAAPALAAGLDDDFLAAREAFRVNDARRLEQLAPRFKGHVLEPYLAYYRLGVRLEDEPAAAIAAFLERETGTLLADRLRGEWLRLLGQRGDWERFAHEYPRLVGEDAEISCYALQRRLALGEREALAEARPLWFAGQDRHEACTPLFDAMVAEGRLSADDIWVRIRGALENGKVTAARRAAEYLPPGQALPAADLAAANDHPQRYLERKRLELQRRAAREVALFALNKLARSAPQQAHFQLERLGDALPEAERAYIAGQIAYHAARRHDPQASAWFKAAGVAPLTEEQRAWRVRAALRTQDWDEALAAIEAMPEAQRREGAWRYWKARALKAAGRGAEAGALLAPLAAEHNFYGQMALEELGGAVTLPGGAYQPGAAEVAATERQPGIRRALALFRLNLRPEAVQEWVWAIRGLGDREYLAAAQLARRHEIWDRAINTAEKTQQLHDFQLRFLAPYRERMRDHTAALDLDEAYVYGLIRQESRFIVDARSSAGAQGLMQLMPATARWVARRIGLRDYRPATVSQVDTNLQLGTHYLRYVLDLFDNQPVLAAAAYNAGPNRARQWRDGRSIEGAIYAETIPFNETRDYVKKVMSNAVYYAALFGQPQRSLRARLGAVAPAGGAEAPLEPEQ